MRDKARPVNANTRRTARILQNSPTPNELHTICIACLKAKPCLTQIQYPEQPNKLKLMTKSVYITNSLLLLRPKFILSSSSPTLSFLPFNYKLLTKTFFSHFSTTSTPYPLQYDMIINRPTQSSLSPTPRTRRRPSRVNSTNSPENLNPEPELGFDNWLDKKLSLENETKGSQPGSDNAAMSKSMRKYYNKRRKRMYGSDSDDDYNKNNEGFVELKPEVVEFDRLHKREEELYFYDTFTYPWEKDKHYKMVYQLEKKYFPDHCLDKAFLETNASQNVKKTKKKMGSKSNKNKDEINSVEDEKGLVFFEEEKSERNTMNDVNHDVKTEVTEKKVQEFFNCLKKVPNKEAEVGSGEPYILTGRTELPSTWDGPFGTMVLINKPKGESIAML